jgi:hypothetical protein
VEEVLISSPEQFEQLKLKFVDYIQHDYEVIHLRATAPRPDLFWLHLPVIMREG